MAQPEPKGTQHQNLSAFLTPNPTTGEIRTATETRAILVTGNLWKALTDSLQGRLSSEFDDVLYSAGRTWGTKTYAWFAQQVSNSRKTLYHTRNMGLSDFKQQFNDYLTLHGWGRFDIYEKYELIFIDLLSSPFPEMLDSPGTMTCSLMAGFFSGFFTELIGVDLSCIELRCTAAAAEKCTFVVADSSITASVRKWLSKGRVFDEIVEAIAAKEYQGKK